jgi:sporadic carbohydrate cluster 2OG-Fe(II) oxygenase
VLLDDDTMDLGRRYRADGFVVLASADPEASKRLRRRVVELTAAWLGSPPPNTDQLETWLDNIHTVVSCDEVNELRVKVMAGLADDAQVRRWIFSIARPWLEALVGNELAMQLRPNLSVQLPGDADSALAIHADTWSGHSPFEAVVWIPLVDCWGTKSLYMVPPAVAEGLWERFAAGRGRSTSDLFDAVVDDVVWIEAAFGQVVVFDHSLPHGNQTNGETTTRWSLNCRFTGLFTPYGDKGLGDFFTPITMRPVTQGALGYEWDAPG